jgi:hypothetical protein
MKIVKTNPRQWRGVGFGTSNASYGVIGRSDIMIKLDNGFWKAYQINPWVLIAVCESKRELEQALKSIN